MDHFTFFGVLIGSIFIILTIGIMIGAFLIYFTVRYAKKHPVIMLFIIALLMAVSMVGLADPVTFIAAVEVIISCMIAVIVQYKHLKKAFRKK